ncbi:SDR family oxidoreductase [Reinekea blandensis]|uniref:NmrA-like domain-containing protein n=1 Tax=Reinekea blandensis MED297 TaxID=314283 RepID=A4BB13_9GAMM|nr:SDR family oxidoreductase [Reinekea blandensis]EAR10626.1 hypothetical protein MED297_11440 [Reinekea sp. MED297] [Reinekea blandensis MED297]
MILVTGATGNVGGLLCRELTERSCVFFRGVSKPTLSNDRRLNFLDPSTFDAALFGIDRVFLVRPPALAKPEKDMRPFLEACQQKGIKQVVFLSLQGAARNPWTPHAKIEAIIRELDLPYTFLQPSFFMQNLTQQHAQDIREHDELFMPAGRGATNFIDARDIALAAAVVLTEPGHEDRSYELTGSQAYRYDEVAALLSQVLGRTIVYSQPGLLRYLWRTWRQGNPLGYALVTGVIYSVARLGKADGYSDALPTLIQRSPISLTRFIEEHRAQWV